MVLCEFEYDMKQETDTLNIGYLLMNNDNVYVLIIDSGTVNIANLMKTNLRRMDSKVNHQRLPKMAKYGIDCLMDAKHQMLPKTPKISWSFDCIFGDFWRRNIYGKKHELFRKLYRQKKSSSSKIFRNEK